MQKSFYIFIGTTAELIKIAPVIREFHKRGIKPKIITSGQNDVQFHELKPFIGHCSVRYAFKKKSIDSSVVKFMYWAVRTFISSLFILRQEFRGLNNHNSYFIVHGDTVSSLIGACIAKIYHLNLIHIESGLRSFNFFEPFPEEICRYLISKLVDVHFCPNVWSAKNLLKTHGIKINTGQNTLIETYLYAAKTKRKHPFLKVIDRQKKKYFVLVSHRQEFVLFRKKRTRKIIKYILANSPKDMACIFVAHDLSMKFINSLNNGLSKKLQSNIIQAKRLPYFDFMHVLEKAEFMVTDGGSNQEEMFYMGKPSLIIRNRTERIEGLGKNIVLGKDNEQTMQNFLNNYNQYKKSKVILKKSPSKIIIDYMMKN